MNKSSGALKKFFNYLIPPPKWRFPVIILTGIIVGLGAHILYISNAVSYLSDDPAACVNCHVMTPQYASWERSAHANFATCNDCHVPQDNFVKTYYFKAMDGLRHSTMFTFRLEPQVIRIKDAGKEAVQANCVRCHAEQIHPIALQAIANSGETVQEERYCWECHRETPHGRPSGLASTPYVLGPTYEPVTPNWIREFLKKNDKD